MPCASRYGAQPAVFIACWQACLNEEHPGGNYWTAIVTVLLRNPCSFT